MPAKLLPAPREDEDEERRRFLEAAAATEAQLRAEIAREQAATSVEVRVAALPRLVPVLSPPHGDVPSGALPAAAQNGHAPPAEPGSVNGRSHTAPEPEASPDRVQAGADALRLLYAPGEVFEVRILETERDGVVGGYFDDPDRAAAAVMTWNGRVPAVYVTLNQLPPAILARAANRLKTKVKVTAADAEVVQRRWLLVDADEQSLTGVSSSRDVHVAPLARIHLVAETLIAEGWPEPLRADSGNGGHALFPIDLPNDEATRRLLERLLKSLAVRFDDPADALPRVTAAMEAASDWDRAYFVAHLGRDRYVRRRLPREFGAREDDPAFPATATYVEVQQVRPGFRLRRAIQVLERRSYPTGAIPWEHAEAFIDSALTRGGKWRCISEDEVDEGADGESA
jgi:hypothetical protein